MLIMVIAVEMTMVSTLKGMTAPSVSFLYSMVTWVLESGRNQPMDPSRRAVAMAALSWWASMMVLGINSGVSSVAYPNLQIDKWIRQWKALMKH